MSKSEMIENLYGEINRQNTWYMWTIGILVAIIAIILAIFGFFQWRLNGKQEESIKQNTINEIVEKYGLQGLTDKVGKLNQELRDTVRRITGENTLDIQNEITQRITLMNNIKDVNIQDFEQRNIILSIIKIMNSHTENYIKNFYMEGIVNWVDTMIENNKNLTAMTLQSYNAIKEQCEMFLEELKDEQKRETEKKA